MYRKKIIVPLAAAVIVISSLGGYRMISAAEVISKTSSQKVRKGNTEQVPTFINNGTKQNWAKAPKGFHPQFNGIVGQVFAVDATNLTVITTTGKTGNATTTYTVDASEATVTKGFPKQNNTTAESVSNIQVGDTIIVRGLVVGTTVTAKSIVDGLPPRL
jgi:hypothetical protein